jgi:hypothetical protein
MIISQQGEAVFIKLIPHQRMTVVLLLNKLSNSLANWISPAIMQVLVAAGAYR